MPDDAAAFLPSPPPHVPPERVFDFDVYGISAHGGEDPDFAHRMKELHHRGTPDVFWTPQRGGHWVAIRADLIEQVYTDNDHFSARYVSVPKENNLDPPLLPVQADPPEWSKYRIFFNKHLSTKAIGGLEPAVRRLAIDLIEKVKPLGRCEFIHDFALHLPIAIFMKIADLPLSDREELLGYVGKIMRSADRDGRIAAHQKLAAYALKMIQARRGGAGEDAITDMANGVVDGQPIPDQTLVGMVILMMLAGLDTVTSMLGFSMRHLALHPEHRAMLRAHPERIPDAVEELLRRYAIVTSSRLVKADVEMDGVTLRAGDMICAPTTLHALDERRYPDPETVDLDRKPRHVTFGGGNHRCPGSALARLELRIAFEEWLKRIPDFDVADERGVIMESKAVATLFALPLCWPTP